MRPAAARDSSFMLVLFGALAYAAAMMTHEALGHGGYCLAVGGHNTVITVWWETCRFAGKPRPGLKAAGPCVQVAGGLLAWLMLHLVPLQAARLRCFLWLYMTWCLLIASGYVAFSSVAGAGDAAELAASRHGRLAWRCAIFVFGSVAYFLSMRAAAYELQRFAGDDDGLQRLFRLVWIPYLSAGMFACCMVAANLALGHGGLATASPGLNRLLGPIGMAVVSSFGAGSGMFGLPPMVRGAVAGQGSPTVPLTWSTTWGVLAGLVLVLFLRYVGPGIQ